MSSGFVSETEINELRRLKQLEWEKVRRPDQPLEVPEEEYDHRTLYDRLQEQKNRKELEYEETHRLKNMVKGLDDDEVEFLEMVDRSKMAEEKKKENEEQKELQRFRDKVASLERQNASHRIQEPSIPVVNNYKNLSSKPSQRKLLAAAIKKKVPDNCTTQANNNDESDSKIRHEKEEASCDTDPPKKDANNRDIEPSDDELTVPSKRSKISHNEAVSVIRPNSKNTTASSGCKVTPPSRTCVAVLPSYYPVTDSSDESSVDEYLDPLKPWLTNTEDKNKDE